VTVCSSLILPLHYLLLHYFLRPIASCYAPPVVTICTGLDSDWASPPYPASPGVDPGRGGWCGARRTMGPLVTLRVPVYQWVPVYRTMTTLASALERLPHYLALTILLSLSCSHHLALTILLSPPGGGAGAAPDDGAD
jgi:hypothetical protein